MGRYVALLRGINVGGNNLIKMMALKACFEAQGFRDVATYPGADVDGHVDRPLIGGTFAVPRSVGVADDVAGRSDADQPGRDREHRLDPAPHLGAVRRFDFEGGRGVGHRRLIDRGDLGGIGDARHADLALGRPPIGL